MKAVQLGEIEGPVMAFGSPASNLQAVMALLGEAARRGVKRGAMICTGGLIGPCGDPGAVVSMLRTLGGPVLPSEAERRLAAGPRRGGALAERDWYRLADDRIPQGDRVWMAGLPEAVLFTRKGKRFAAVADRGGVAAPDGGPDVSDDVLRMALERLGGDLGPLDAVLAGGSGHAFRRVVDGVEWIGTGSAGLPPGDGRMQTRFVLVNSGIARLHRLDYDVAGALAKMQQVGLDRRWQDALAGAPAPARELLPGPRAA
ncbi:hypothetical protein [Mangrovicoccus sp. HB161399]|uniref:hypothetical protein n=1 Tax=Mangrovicoccus sp. HB161399 TaxID=2720392 RepID=UPI0015546965|nr:hypothetical protein [Mangrovicoccus sp. HB161399]